MKKYFTNNSLLNIIKLMNSDEGEQLFHKKIPIKISFALQSNLEIIQSAYANYEKTLKTLGENYNVDLSQNIQIKNFDNQDFVEELNDLIQTKVELNIQTITYADLEKCDEDKYDVLTSNELGLFFWMVEEDEDKEEA